MGRIDSQTERMARLVNDLLLLANLDRPEFIARSTHDVAAIVADAVNDFTLVAPQYPTAFRSIGPALADVDPLRIRQVVDNLLHNIRTHTVAGTAATTDVVAVAGTVTLVINNGGPGIPPADLDRMFQRFWRSSHDRSSDSSGLGLAIVESIVSAHDGTIKVRSNDHEGTTFTITIPTKPPAR
jgi:two-component system, OmpR family, sensor kinase